MWLAAKLIGMFTAFAAAQPPSLPRDLDAESRARLPYLQRKDMSEADQKTFDVLPGKGKDDVLRGPLAFAAYNPGAAKALFDLHNAAVAGTLNAHVRELAIMVACRETNYNLEWNGHEATALKNGVDAKLLDVIRRRGRFRHRREGRRRRPPGPSDVQRQESGVGDVREGRRAVRPPRRHGYGGRDEHLRGQRILCNRRRRTAGVR